MPFGIRHSPFYIFLQIMRNQIECNKMCGIEPVKDHLGGRPPFAVIQADRDHCKHCIEFKASEKDIQDQCTQQNADPRHFLCQIEDADEDDAPNAVITMDKVCTGPGQSEWNTIQTVRVHFLQTENGDQAECQRKKYVLVTPVKDLAKESKIKRQLGQDREDQQPDQIIQMASCMMKAFYDQKAEYRKRNSSECAKDHLSREKYISDVVDQHGCDRDHFEGKAIYKSVISCVHKKKLPFV